ncbi:hypothetical protein [Tianweitania sp.]|uniref:hypothetical protein n=1 Tax=Tianweitania sp. TaxID=2021634 RepID=UPI00289752DD|nr:hypothetical protein [Tianweitania sp.]
MAGAAAGFASLSTLASAAGDTSSGVMGGSEARSTLLVSVAGGATVASTSVLVAAALTAAPVAALRVRGLAALSEPVVSAALAFARGFGAGFAASLVAARSAAGLVSSDLVRLAACPQLPLPVLVLPAPL